MQIAFVEIQNFRKLKACRIGIADTQTVFVGANNSGKTSAMDALILFLKQNRRRSLATTDFTLSNWPLINSIGDRWIEPGEDEAPELAAEELLALMPSIDVWLQAGEEDLHHLRDLLPTLDWTPEELLGVRLILTPKDTEQLYRNFRAAHAAARSAESTATDTKRELHLWPKTLREYLDRHLFAELDVQSFLLDPDKRQDPEGGLAKTQELPKGSKPIGRDPLSGLVKIDVITAQRGFADPKSDDDSQGGFASLSNQLRNYFTKHLDPSTAPDPSDIDALSAIEEARSVFNDKLEASFRPALGELERLNYPGFSDPHITITSQIDPRESLDHDTAVQFTLPGSDSLSLPENHNGLGYQNLISMVFNLIRFRDEWMREGKAAREKESEDLPIEPLHLVLVEEPEAHLHAQVQQAFIKKAYGVLRSHPGLQATTFSTQLVVSTHSSHIAHELDFSCLRYFRREEGSGDGEIPTATVVDLSEAFGDQDETTRFTKRYLQTTHCDLFFADAAILVEGSAERILLPHFIRKHLHQLDTNYVSLLEIGGAHAHRLKSLLETLGLLTLIITDLDSIKADSRNKGRPERDQGCRTGNTTLRDWVPREEALDELLDLESGEKETSDGLFRASYQCPVRVEYKQGADLAEAIPYTFEDALALENLDLIRSCKNPKGLLKKLKSALDRDTLEDAMLTMFNDLESGSKAEFALELLFLNAPDEVRPPAYIREGLEWLQNKLEKRKLDAIGGGVLEAGEAAHA